MRAAALLAAGALAAFALAPAAQAQAPEPCVCAPFQDDDEWYALVISYNLVGNSGAWLRWRCYPQKITEPPTPLRTCTIGQPWSSISLDKLGSRAETIRRWPDGRLRTPAEAVAAFKAAWKRHVSLPLSDPSLDALRAEIDAAGK